MVVAIIVDYMPNPIGTQFSIDHIPTPCGLLRSRLCILLWIKNIILIQRYGVDRSIPPHQVNYAANIWSLYALGIKNIYFCCLLWEVLTQLMCLERWQCQLDLLMDNFEKNLFMMGHLHFVKLNHLTPLLVQLSKKVLGHYPLSFVQRCVV